MGNGGQLADRKEGGGEGDEEAGDCGYDVRRLPPGMDAGKLLRKQAVARHDEEDARLAKQHHQHHRRQGEEGGRSEEHTSDLQSLMRISSAVFCLKKTNTNQSYPTRIN